jgi:transmembrane sensor
MDQNFTYITDDLLAKYLLGEATMAEQQEVERWASLNPENRKQLEDFRNLLEASAVQTDLQVDAHQALEKLNNRIERNVATKSLNYKPILRWVAILAVVFSAGLFFYQNTIGSKLNVSTAGNTLIQELPDGSVATLNKQSSVTFVGGVFNPTRAIKLKGEAFFKVVANKNKPFIIEVNGVKVTVVGTAFNVKNEGDETIVSVESGIVKVENNRNSVRLTAGEKAEVRNNQLLKGENHGKLYNYYYSNQLVCDRTPLYELVEVLNKKFNANIVIVNPAVQELPISTTFENNSLQDILRVVSETLNVRVAYGQGIIKLQ